MAPKIAFRTDASVEIGAGHVMRCLSLAGALREGGKECHFICREHIGHLGELIRGAGHELTLLPAPGAGTERGSSELPWLGASWEEDAKQTIQELHGAVVDWLIVDHYSLDARWERELRSACRRILVIDDLANREHDCDLLLDQNLGRTPSEYAELVPSGCEIVTGPRHALLRPEFAGLREYSLQRRRRFGLEQILVSMGGVDPQNATSEVLNALETSGLPMTCRVTAVIGAHAPWAASVARTFESTGRLGEVVVGASNMAELMAECDLAIGGGGSTSWERCALGVPAILFALADNQIAPAKALHGAGAALFAGGVDRISEALPDAIAAFMASGRLGRMSDEAASVTDGRGCGRVASLMGMCGRQASNILVRHMTEADLDDVRAWRNAPAVRASMYSQYEIDEQEHLKWFLRCAADRHRHLLIVERDGARLGFVQIRETAVAVAEWGFYVVPGAPKGSGFAVCTAALGHAFRELGLYKLCGQVIATNEKSAMLHRKLGFTQEGTLRRQHFSGRDYVDVLCFGLLSSEFSKVE
jgi:UDP-2,4-diacetamido-2,4,6-trideoxy-beta-L-altropyranose hydrolase/UDP-4-amino-4,6-dideoxy-N-acetyl-beta-L-altrosamine N-acetyltransferase